MVLVFVFVLVIVVFVFVIVFQCDSPVRCALWRRPAGRWHRFPGRKGTEHDTRAEPVRPWNWQQHCQKQAEHCILMMSRVISMLLMIIMRLWWWWGRRWRRWWWWLWDNDDGDNEDGVDAAADDDYEMTLMIMMMVTLEVRLVPPVTAGGSVKFWPNLMSGRLHLIETVLGATATATVCQSSRLTF